MCLPNVKNASPRVTHPLPAISLVLFASFPGHNEANIVRARTPRSPPLYPLRTLFCCRRDSGTPRRIACPNPLPPHALLRSAGTSVASGLVIPSLIIGAGMGRLVGEGLHWVLAALGMGTEWADPGLFAFVGAGAFFGGVSRLTVSLVVIMLELTGSLNHLLPLMTAVMTAKWVADGFTHPLYHALLQVA